MNERFAPMGLLLLGAVVAHADSAWERHIEASGTPFEARWAIADPLYDQSSAETLLGAAGIRADMVAASVHLDHLLQKKVIKRIETDVYFPAMKTGYKNTWFVGVSLGGLNSLLFYEKYAEDICGVVLLAPYLGDKVITNAIKKAGGIHRWEPDHIDNPNDIKNKELVDLRAQNLWRWIKRQKKSNTLQNIYLGHGAQDRYAEAHKLLANFLDDKNVTVIEGKHEWKTGRKLWQKQLAERSGSGLLKPCR